MTAPRLTIGSLFSGIGGLELGLECAGLGPTLFQVERDEFCRGVLAKHWPSAMRFDDVLAVGAHNLPRVDVLCGGFPCQDISVAGRRVGIHGERSGLWFEYVRIIRELRPRYVVVENVAALLVRGLDVVLGELAESGYDAEWDCIPASAVGAPHRRDRLFLLAYSAVDRSAFGGPGNEGCDLDSPRREPVRGESRRGGADADARALADAARRGQRADGRSSRQARYPDVGSPAMDDAVLGRHEGSAEGPQTEQGKYAQGGTALSTQVGGRLNPTWVEWLMGFPPGHTAFEHWVTPSSRKSRKSSAGES